jgi:hypothetical protein
MNSPRTGPRGLRRGLLPLEDLQIVGHPVDRGQVARLHRVQHAVARTRRDLARELIDELTSSTPRSGPRDKQLRQLVAADLTERGTRSAQLIRATVRTMISYAAKSWDMSSPG